MDNKVYVKPRFRKLKDNEFKVFTNKIYSLEDTIDLNIPSKNSNYIEKQNKIIEIIDGKIEHYNLNITNYYFDTNYKYSRNRKR